jgi:hypothetical protein
MLATNNKPAILWCPAKESHRLAIIMAKHNVIDSRLAHRFAEPW